MCVFCSSFLLGRDFFSLDTFLLSKGGWGEILFVFFLSPLVFSRVLSLSLDVENRESYGEMHLRDGDDAISLRSLRFLLLFVFFERERVKELKRNLSLFFSPLRWVFVVQRKLLFFSLVKQRNKKKAKALTDIFYVLRYVQLN